MVVILDLGFSQCRLLDHRPEHRLGASVERTAEQELAQLADDLRLCGEVHRRVGMRPVADDAEPPELLALHVDPVPGEGAALAAQLKNRYLVLALPLLAVALLDLPFDRQAVAVPARA